MQDVVKKGLGYALFIFTDNSLNQECDELFNLPKLSTIRGTSFCILSICKTQRGDDCDKYLHIVTLLKVLSHFLRFPIFNIKFSCDAHFCIVGFVIQGLSVLELLFFISIENLKSNEVVTVLFWFLYKGDDLTDFFSQRIQ